MLVLNKNILTIGGNRLEGGPLTPPEPPAPTILEPDTVPVQTPTPQPYTIYYTPSAGGTKLTRNTEYIINYPEGYTITQVSVIRAYGSSWDEETISSGSPSSISTIALNFTEEEWNDTMAIYIRIEGPNIWGWGTQVIFQPVTLTPVS